MVGEIPIPNGGLRLDLFVRSSTPPAARERQSAAIERLRTLENGAGIETFAVRPWEKRIPVGKRTRDTEGTGRVYGAFREWACAHGADLRPFFDTRECHSSVTGESHTALVLPVICLAVSTGEHLHAVFPHATGGRIYTVDDALDAIETERAVAPAAGTS